MSDQPQEPERRQGVPIWVFVVCLLAVAVVAGFLVWTLRGCAPTVTPPADTTVTTTPTTTVETPAVVATVSAEPTAAAPADGTGLPYTPGPDESGENWGYVREMNLKDDYVYVVVDYIVIGEDPDGGWMITNDNPKLRTFPLTKKCACRYIAEGGSSLSAAIKPQAFRTKWLASPADQMIRMNPYKLTLSHGVVTKLENEWLP